MFQSVSTLRSRFDLDHLCASQMEGRGLFVEKKKKQQGIAGYVRHPSMKLLSLIKAETKGGKNVLPEFLHHVAVGLLLMRSSRSGGVDSACFSLRG